MHATHIHARTRQREAATCDVLCPCGLSHVLFTHRVVHNGIPTPQLTCTQYTLTHAPASRGGRHEPAACDACARPPRVGGPLILSSHEEFNSSLETHTHPLAHAHPQAEPDDRSQEPATFYTRDRRGWAALSFYHRTKNSKNQVSKHTLMHLHARHRRHQQPATFYIRDRRVWAALACFFHRAQSLYKMVKSNCTQCTYTHARTRRPSLTTGVSNLRRSMPTTACGRIWTRSLPESRSSWR